VALETRLRPFDGRPFGDILRAPVGKVISRNLHIGPGGILRSGAAQRCRGERSDKREEQREMTVG
jgi:hypothetical protein